MSQAEREPLKSIQVSTWRDAVYEALTGAVGRGPPAPDGGLALGGPLRCMYERVSPLAEILRERRDEILRRWTARAGAPETSVMMDVLPRYLELLTTALEMGPDSEAADAVRAAAQQSGRGDALSAVRGMDVDRLASELRHLRQVVVEVTRERVEPTVEEVLALTDLLAGTGVAALRTWSDERQALLQGILARVPVGLALVDSELHYVQMNERLAALRGVEASSIIGRTIREAFPALADFAEPRYRQVLATGQPILDVDFPAPSATGHGYYVGSWFPVRNTTGQVFMVGAVVVDITRRKHDEEELRRAREFEQQLIGIVSHDLRNPLGAILLSANALLAREDLADRHLRSIVRIRSAADRATRLIHDLLDLTRTRLTGSIPIEPRPADLATLVDEVVEELRPAYADREIVVERRGRFDGTWDPDRMSQLVANLAGNALKYGRPDAPVRVELDGEAGGAVILRVHNQGAIPRELLGRLFQPGHRAAEHGGAVPGVGLGLFIVKQIVAAHGGTIQVRSSEAEGTTFEIDLPRQPGR
jgi:PAS domain S-box-containing protein